MKTRNQSALIFFTLVLMVSSAFAADPKSNDKASSKPTPQTTGSPSLGGAEEVNVESIKQKYWARGDESELGVVQNRMYSKERKFTLTPYVGSISSDPFLSVKSVGGEIGYNLSEYISVNLLYFKYFVSEGAAQEGLNANLSVPIIPPTNYTKSYIGGEIAASILYGKLSLVGKAIIYYDMHLLVGLGVTNTENKAAFTPSFGVGQQIYLNKWSALRFDYRVMTFSEDLIRKKHPAEGPILTAPFEGAVIGNRRNWSHTITLGVNFLFGL
jgi:outer membrane beta-barrel protein